MTLYFTKEETVVYKVLLCSNDADLIYYFEKICLKRNILLETIRENTPSNKIKNSSYVLYVVYDLRDYSKDISKIITLLKENSKYKKIILLNNTNNKTITSNQLTRDTNHYLILDRIGKPESNEIARNYFDNAGSSIPRVLNLVRIKKRSKKKLNYKNIIISFASLFLILPYFLVIGLFLNDYILSTLFKANIAFTTVKHLSEKNYFSKKNTLGIVNVYKQIPAINLLYPGVYKYVSSSFESTRAFNKYTQEIAEIENSINQYARGRYRMIDDQIIGTHIQTDNNAKNLLTRKQLISLSKIKNINALISDYFNGNNGKYFLLVLQNDPYLYPTGRGIAKTILFNIDNGAFEKVEELTGHELSSIFKGNIKNIPRMAGDNGDDQINTVFEIKDKYATLKTIFKEGKNVNLTSIVFMDYPTWKELDIFKDHIFQKEASMTKLFNVFDLVINSINGKQLAFVIEDGNETFVESENIFNEFGSKITDCMDHKIQLFETGEKNINDKSGYKLSGNIDKDIFEIFLSVEYKPVGLKEIIIKRPMDFFDRISSTKKITNTSWNNIYETIDPNNLREGELLAKYKIPIKACNDGFAVTIEKQIGNESVEINYEVVSYEQLYLFINNNLTGRGNKFYNTQSVKLSEDLIFKFIK